MRLFQNSGLSGAYRDRMERIAKGAPTFAARRAAFLADRYGASHFLEPVLAGSEEAFLTNGDDETLQRLWASEQGLPSSTTMEDILLAQIEAHRAEVFYNLDPMRWQSRFVRRLPGCVRRAVCWRAAPSPGADFSAYHAVVCNFPSIIDHWRAKGWRAELMYPAHDPAMDDIVDNAQRSIDVLFVGTYSRHHGNRARVLEAVASLSGRYRVQYCLDRSRMTRLAESPLGWIGPLARHRRPGAIKDISSEPVFGIDLYRLLGRSRIVLNGAIDMAGDDRGNMRCFEAMGAGALLVSDKGRYPEGIEDGRTMLTYEDADDAISALERALGDWPRHGEMAKLGRDAIRSLYSKARQYERFRRLVASL